MDHRLKLDTLIAGYEAEMVARLSEALQIKSLREAGTEGAPFGPGIRLALTQFLKLAQSMGFDVVDYDGYAGEASWGGTAEGESFGILGHLDVVPEGDGWSVDPYGGVVKDGKVFGRGAIDDKGPLLAALYALKAVKELGLPLKRRVKIIMGTDEESGFGCMHYYLEHASQPTLAITPDGAYPVIYTEKGILDVHIDCPIQGGALSALMAGTRSNVVPGVCKLVLNGPVDLPSLPALMQAEPTSDGKGIQITVNGKSAHASTPEEGDNAAVKAINLLATLPIAGKETFAAIASRLSTYDGSGMQINGGDFSGSLTMNVGILRLQDGVLTIMLNIRYPVTTKGSAVVQQIAAAFNGVGKVTASSDSTPHHVPIDSPLVTSLLQIYKDATGIDAQPLAIGGGTYARVLRNAVAFGPLPDDAEETAHQPNEYIGIDTLVLNARLMSHAIAALAGEDAK